MKLLTIIAILFLTSCSSSKRTTKRIVVRTDTTDSVFYTDSSHVIIWYEDGYKDKRIKRIKKQ